MRQGRKEEAGELHTYARLIKTSLKQQGSKVMQNVARVTAIAERRRAKFDGVTIVIVSLYDSIGIEFNARRRAEEKGLHNMSCIE